MELSREKFFAGIGMGLFIVTYDTQYVYNLGLSRVY